MPMKEDASSMLNTLIFYKTFTVIHSDQIYSRGNNG